MNYKGKRNNENYQKLVKECICWWKEKLTDEKIGFTENVKISFAFKVNGNSIIKALNGRILLQNTQTIELNKELIETNNKIEELKQNRNEILIRLQFIKEEKEKALKEEWEQIERMADFNRLHNPLRDY